MFHNMEQTTTERIASNIRSELGRRRISNREVARLCGWPPANANRRINGQQAMTIDDLELIARCTEIPIAVLMDGVHSTAQAEAGHAGLSFIVPAGFAAALVLLAGASGKLDSFVQHLPIPHPAPSGFALLCLLVLGCGCTWRMRRAETTPHEPADYPPRDDVWFATQGTTEVGPDAEGTGCPGHPPDDATGSSARRAAGAAAGEAMIGLRESDAIEAGR